jgi:hypothetical protein
MASSIASNQILNVLAKSEVVQVSRKAVLESTSANASWGQIEEMIESAIQNASSSSSAALPGAAATAAATTSSSTAAVAMSELVSGFLSSIALGATNSVKKVFSTVAEDSASLLSVFSESMTNTAVWVMKKKGEMFAIGNELVVVGFSSSSEKGGNNNNTVVSSSFSSLGAFSAQQEHFLSGIISSLHRQHMFTLTEAQKKTILVCGATALASCGLAAAATWYVISKRKKTDSSSSSSEQQSANKMKIKNLTFQGTSEEFVEFLEKLQNQHSNKKGSSSPTSNNRNAKKNFFSSSTPQKMSIEIENVSLIAGSSEDSFVTEVGQVPVVGHQQ